MRQLAQEVRESKLVGKHSWRLQAYPHTYVGCDPFTHTHIIIIIIIIIIITHGSRARRKAGCLVGQEGAGGLACGARLCGNAQ